MIYLRTNFLIPKYPDFDLKPFDLSHRREQTEDANSGVKSILLEFSLKFALDIYQ